MDTTTTRESHDAAQPRTTVARALAGPAGVAAGAAGSLALVGLVDPNVPGTYPVCPSLSLFGVLCPLCGGLRGAHALASADLGAMVSSNLLLPVIVVAAAWGWISWTSSRLGRRLLPPVPITNRGLAIFGILAVVYGVLRNLPWEPFVALAP